MDPTPRMLTEDGVSNFLVFHKEASSVSLSIRLSGLPVSRHEYVDCASGDGHTESRNNYSLEMQYLILPYLAERCYV